MKKIEVNLIKEGETYILDYNDEKSTIESELSVKVSGFRKDMTVLKILKIDFPYFSYKQDRFDGQRDFGRLDQDGLIFYVPSPEFVKSLKRPRRDDEDY